MRLNSILASPAFQSWLEGDPLDVARLLYDENGEPRHTVFYIAHLSDEERMFFVTLLYSAVEGWMRTQAGTTTLRALVYFDEIFGYLPPIGNPPSRSRCCACSNRPAPSASASCWRHRTRWTWTTRRSPTPGAGSSASWAPTRTSSGCSTVWRAPRRAASTAAPTTI